MTFAEPAQYVLPQVLVECPYCEHEQDIYIELIEIHYDSDSDIIDGNDKCLIECEKCSKDFTHQRTRYPY